ncbi:hypothetical protein [Ruminiclostridium cellobioparum]|uniref:hypothetical protein n=1 Tax=Ruminiclostridium cellobioparum TaxID=29355 RepID=UPI0028B26302|nr:hypothetical protein [Ruminiclostridium cellobioparum]
MFNGSEQLHIQNLQHFIVRYLLKNRQYEQFGDREINLCNSQVKKPRNNQPVLPLHSRIIEIFETHKKFLKEKYGIEHIIDGLHISPEYPALQLREIIISCNWR